MNRGYVITENYKRLREAEKAVERRGAREAGLVIVKGAYGVGKTSLLQRWASDVGAVYLRAREVWTKRALLDDLANKMGLDTRGRNAEVEQRVINRLQVDMATIVIDEADFLIRSTPALLETVRDITDNTGCACILVGMEGFPAKVARHPHIASRVARIVELRPLTVDDVQAVCNQLCEVKLQIPVVEEIHKQTGGRMRLILNAIANLEQWANANGWREVAAEHIKGKTLVVEFRSGDVGRNRESL